jgi:acetyl-CoA acetyltransferase
MQAAIVGVGASRFARALPDSQLGLAAVAMKAALDDAGLSREEIDGLSIHQGSPLGVDYDRLAEGLGLDIRYVNQAWLHGRFVTSCLQHAALAVNAGLAKVVACVTAVSFSRERAILAGTGDHEGSREEGGTHGEAPPYGLTSPASGAAMAMQRYMALYGVTSADLAAVPIAIRQHALRNPGAIMQVPLSLDDHQNARLIIDPLRLFDCCLISDAAVVVLVASADRARDLRKRSVRIASMQGIRAGRNEFIFAPPGLGVSQQTSDVTPHRPDDGVMRALGLAPSDVDAFYTYDAFSPLVLFALERYGYCGRGEAGAFVKHGRIGPGGALPVNTSGGLLSEAHVSGWNSIREMVLQIRGEAGARQLPRAEVLHWGTPWGDSVILTP